MRIAKLGSFVVTLFAFIFLFGMQAYAASEEDHEVLDLLQWSESDVLDHVSHNESFVYNTTGITLRDDEALDYLKDFGPLVLKNSFDKAKTTTFSESKTISGTALEDTVIGLAVFHIETSKDTEGNTKKSLVVTQERKSTIGLSGLYSDSVNLEYVGTNYVLIAARDNSQKDKPIYYRLFKVIRKELETKEKLENIQVEFIQDTEGKSPNLQEYIPSINNLTLE